MSLFVAIGRKEYNLENLTRMQRRFIQHWLRTMWDKHIDGLKKKINIPKCSGLLPPYALLWAKAERLLEALGEVSRNTERAMANASVAAFRSRENVIDITRYRGWKEFSQGRLSIKSRTFSNSTIQERHVSIYCDGALVFAVEYSCCHQGSPQCKVTTCTRGDWKKLLDDAWVDHCERLRADDNALKRHWGVESLSVFDSDCVTPIR